MVAIVKKGLQISEALNYNEKKVHQGKAVLIHAANFTKDTSQLSYHDKIGILQKRTSLNERFQKKALHITLNFSPGTPIRYDQLKAIASEYLQHLDLHLQPCLVYRHFDASHPHIHIVSTSIRRDGSAITFPLKASYTDFCNDLAERMGLSWKGPVTSQYYVPRPEDAQRVRRGKKLFLPAANRILDTVTNRYIFTSLDELNAVLGLYQLKACPTKKAFSEYPYRGLLYRALNENGKFEGLPLKASLLPCKPTIDHLERRFEENQGRKTPYLGRVQTMVDFTLLKNPGSDLSSLNRELAPRGIQCVVCPPQKKKAGNLYFVDHESRCVFSLSDLKASLQEKIHRAGFIEVPGSRLGAKLSSGSGDTEDALKKHGPAPPRLGVKPPDGLDILTRVEPGSENTSPGKEFKSRKKNKNRLIH